MMILLVAYLVLLFSNINTDSPSCLLVLPIGHALLRVWSQLAREHFPYAAGTSYHTRTRSFFAYLIVCIYLEFLGASTSAEVNCVHKRALRVLLNDFTSSFEELLHRKEEVIIHEENLQKLMLEVY